MNITGNVATPFTRFAMATTVPGPSTSTTGPEGGVPAPAGGVTVAVKMVVAPRGWSLIGGEGDVGEILDRNDRDRKICGEPEPLNDGSPLRRPSPVNVAT